MTLDFSKLGVAAVHEGLTDETTLMTPEIAPRTPGTHAWGRAVTVRNAPGDNLALHRALVIAEAGDFIVIGDNGVHGPATWGGMVTHAAVGKGLAGAVVDGAARDLATYRELGFPVWSRMVSSRRATKQHAGLVNEPVTCGGVVVNPGDYIVADDDGVVVVRQDEVESAMTLARAREDREAGMVSELLAGRTPFELLDMGKVLERSDS